MGSRSDELEDLQEQGQMNFARKVLDDTFHLTHDEYQDAAVSIPEIIRIATEMLAMPKPELATKLVNLRNFAAHNQVEITLPEDIMQAAREEASRREPRRDLRPQPKTLITESSKAGLLRTLERGRENT